MSKQENLELYGYRINKLPKVRKLPEWVDKLKQISMDDVLEKTIVVLDYIILKSKKFSGKNFVIIRIALGPNDERKIVTGSTVLMNQLEEYKDYIPYGAVIVKQGNYYTFRF